MSEEPPISGEVMPDGEGMSAGSHSTASFATTAGAPVRTPFPWERLLYSIGFGIVAWCVFWVVMVLAFMQFVLVLLQSVTANVTGHPSEELKRFCLMMIQYLLELLAYITFARETPPFPFSPFPSAPQTKPGS